MERLRDLGLRIGDLEPGPRNAITDVLGVCVGQVTVRRDEPDPPEGRGIARTGVTAIVPGPLESLVSTPIAAGTAVLNGAGELTGSLQIGEWGCIARARTIATRCCWPPDRRSGYSARLSASPKRSRSAVASASASALGL